jgi:hypothetical protein
MAKIMGNPTVTPMNVPGTIEVLQGEISENYATKEHQISVWSPNTAYKKGEWVFTIDDENPFMLANLYVCTENHVSGDTFTLGGVWGGRSLKANIALNDYLGKSIHGTYATKADLTAAIGEALEGDY